MDHERWVRWACWQVVLALPDRRETRQFFPFVVAAGFRWRLLRRVLRDDCVHPIHIYQLVPAATAAASPATPAPAGAGCVASAAAAVEAMAAHFPDSPIAAEAPSKPATQVCVTTVSTCNRKAQRCTALLYD